MTNIAYIDFDHQKKRKEAHVAELEKGFTRLANVLLDVTMASGLSETELCVVLAIWRKTYGYGKKMDWLSNEQLGRMILKHHTHCSTAKNLLIQKGVLLQAGRKVGINTNISEWKTKGNGFCKSSDKKSTKKATLAELAKKEALAESAMKTLAEPANETKQKLLNTKENIQKKKENNPLTPLPPQKSKFDPLTQKPDKTHSQLALTANGAKPTRRKPMSFDYQAYLNAYNEIVGDRLPHAVEASNERKRKLKLLVDSLANPTLDGFQKYVTAFLEDARPFHFGENDRGWRANFDFLLRRSTLTKIREGTLQG